jgi:hypothetical protein
MVGLMGPSGEMVHRTVACLQEVPVFRAIKRVGGGPERVATISRNRANKLANAAEML